MGCGLTKMMKVHEVTKLQDSSSQRTSNPPKISIAPMDPINVDRRMPKGYIEPDSSITYTEINEEEQSSPDDV